jgi:hypothetical protein
MIQDLTTIILLSLVPCCLGYFLDYCLGQPGSDQPKVSEIFSGYTLWLSRKALQPGRMQEIYSDHQPLLSSEDAMTRVQGDQQVKQVIIEDAKKLFTWQKAVGMCPFCTNVWISWLFVVVLFIVIPFHALTVVIPPICLFLLIPIFSHTILRKL